MSFDSINSTKLWFFLRTGKFLYKTPVVLDNTNLLLINTYQLHISIILLSLWNTLKLRHNQFLQLDWTPI